MTPAPLSLLGLFPLCASVAAGQPRTKLIPPAEPRQQVRQEVGQFVPDTQRVIRLANGAGYRVHGVLAQQGVFFAVLAEQDGTLFVLAIRDSSKASFVGDPIAVGEVEPAAAKWFALDGRGVTGLAVTMNDAVENTVGTALYAVKGARLVNIYADSLPTCRPAELRDLSGDGRLELLVYQEDPAGNDCNDPCYVLIAAKLDMTPAWVGVLHWTGSAWEDVSAQFPAFYGALAVQLDSLGKWLTAPQAQPCRESWLSPDGIVKQWVQRALRISSRDRSH